MPHYVDYFQNKTMITSPDRNTSQEAM